VTERHRDTEKREREINDRHMTREKERQRETERDRERQRDRETGAEGQRLSIEIDWPSTTGFS
jgi:hypothetical protein